MLLFIAVVLFTIILLFLLWLLILVRPRSGKVPDERLLCDYAHRGLHGNGVPENSLCAFEKACGAGYGIELDVQLSRDSKVMVFHDYTLDRMTGCDKHISELDASELEKLSLCGSDETIPKFEAVLKTVNGRVPLLVELKGESLDTSLCEKTAALLKAYDGAYCIESFNPLLLKEMRRCLPDAYIGQLYTNVCKSKKKYTPLNMVLTAMALNFLAKPDFIAYDRRFRTSLPVLLTTGFYRAARFVWTARTAAEREEAKRLGEHAIFEIE